MPKKMLIDATHAEETRVVVVDGNKVEEFDFESENRRQLAGNIYLAKVTRVEPSLQAAFVDYGGNRHGFLAFSEIHPDYYQIPIADRQALLEEERAYAEALAAKDEEEPKPKRRTRGKGRQKAARTETADAKISADIEGMETLDLGDEDDVIVSDEEASSPMERVSETPVDTPDATEADLESEGAPEENTEDDALSDDESIEAVADDDDPEDIRLPRKPRPRRYKIQEVIKVRQILLVQVVKEERGNKGAALTTYLSLAGRYCVLMPNTARGGGISRKITNAADRKKLKEIAGEINVPQGAGLIIRTAGAKRTRAEIKRDYEYLQRLWEQIRERTLKSIAPTKIYEEGDLIKRSIRDLYNREIEEVLVEGERGYRIAKDFMKMIMPSHAKNVKRYEEALPLYARFQVESYLTGMFNPTVQLPSGGYIVIGVTEALVAIDVNSGRATKEGSIEQTALKTNLEAADEVARQLRLRDLAGLIVIDFIDMDERKHNSAIEKRMKDRLKTDRARIQVGRISGFGLMEMSRQRLRPGMIEATTQPCPHCHGTGLVRSDDNLALSILRQVEEEGTRRRSREVLVKTPVGIANFMMNQKREHVARIEARYGLSVRVEGDPQLVSPDFSIERFKTASRSIAAAELPIISVDTSLMDQVDESEADAEAQDGDAYDGHSSGAPGSEEDSEGRPKRRRRRRRGRGRGRNTPADDRDQETSESSEEVATEKAADTAVAVEEHPPSKIETTDDAEVGDASAAPQPEVEEKPKRRGRKVTSKADTAAEASEGEDEKTAAAAKEKPRRRTRKGKTAAQEDQGDALTEAAPQEAKAEAEEEPPQKPKRKSRARVKQPVAETAETDGVKVTADETEVPPKRTRAKRGKTAAQEMPVAEEEKPKRKRAPRKKAQEPAQGSEPLAEQPQLKSSETQETSVTATEDVTAAPEETSDAAKPKRRGWWSFGR
ncbi:MAG: Rne/Rng family ribonuclease [Pseudomonadota bacterium]